MSLLRFSIYSRGGPAPSDTFVMLYKAPCHLHPVRPQRSRPGFEGLVENQREQLSRDRGPHHQESVPLALVSACGHGGVDFWA